MPVRPDGLRATFIKDPGPVFHRMNFSQKYLFYISGACYDVATRVINWLGFSDSTNRSDYLNRRKATKNGIAALPPDVVSKCYAYLQNFYRCIGFYQFEGLGKLEGGEIHEHLADIVREGYARVFIPVHNTKSPARIVLDIEKHFKPVFTTVKYRGASGNIVETIKKVRIAPQYNMLLDKTTDEWSATASARLQHFGIVSPITKSEKFTYPFNNSPTKITGETEFRIMTGYTGVESIAEMFDRSSNAIARRDIYWNLMNDPKPSAISRIVNRDVVPLGNSRPIQIANHSFLCLGFLPVYTPETWNEPSQS